MIISSLCEYYAIMAKNGKVTKEGYTSQKITHLICLNEDGTISDIIPLGKKEGKKDIYPEMLFPLRTQKPGIEANFIEHRPLYIFGLNYENGVFTPDDRTRKAEKSHEAFVKKSLEIVEDLQDTLVRAYGLFVRNWTPAAETENKFLLSLGGAYKTACFAFCLSGKINDCLQDCKEIKDKWEEALSASDDGGVPSAVCPIYGEELPVAKLHDKIKGVTGGQASGCILVCFNNESENSYGKEQSYNSGISVRAMKEYTEALNYVLKSPEHHTYMDGMTVGYFAMTDKKEEDYMDAINISFAFTFPSAATEKTEEEEIKEADAENVERNLNTVAENAAAGKGINFSYFDKLDESVQYCIFGLAPNSSRIMIKFFYRDNFGNLRKNIERWHKDFAVGTSAGAPEFWKIRSQLKSPKSSDNLPPDITEKLFNSAVNGAPLPEKILETVIRRIKTDSDTEKSHSVKMNDTRIGLLKTCLNRKNKDGKEEITVSLNLENKNPAYLCGRLFAVLEKAQQDAAGGTLNKTIKDTYFSSAAATPATVFPALIKLSGTHQAKLAEKGQIYYNRLISSIVDNLEEFPKTLSLEQQGNFIIGYYQQNKDLYTAKNSKEEL